MKETALIFSILQIAAFGALTLVTPAGTAQELSPSFAPALLDINQLPRFRPVTKVGALSSNDPTGGNDDGFSGRHSFLRKESDDGLVIAEVFGPGVITRMFTAAPLPEAPIEFYFDGEDRPRLVLPLAKLFSGDTAPFTTPLVGHGIGGYYSYVPLEFERSIKVVVRAKTFHFYSVNYASYEPGVRVRTFDPGDSFRFPSLPNEGTRVSGEGMLPPGKSITLFESHEPGRIQSLRLSPADAFSGKDRSIVLRIYWDGARQPAVEVPLGDFFGYAYGSPAARALLLGTEGNWNYVRFPMPYARSARLEIISEREDGEPIPVRWQMLVSHQAKAADEGYFHAEWRRENPTVRGIPFTYLDVVGRGHLVAVILQAQGKELGQTYFFEGDEGVTLDGEVRIRGTGSEDSFNGGWYDVPGRWDSQRSLPFSGSLGYDKPVSRTGGYRLLLPDAYGFHRSLHYTVEHGGEGNSIEADYVGTTFYYLNRPEGRVTTLAPAATRTVQDPNGFVLRFGDLSIPTVRALMSASLQRGGVDIDDDWVSFTSFAADTRSSMPPPMLRKKWHALAGLAEEPEPFGPPSMVLTINAPKAGIYEIHVDGLLAPDGALLQLRVNDQPTGKALNFFAPVLARSEARKLGELHLDEGLNDLTLSLPGSRPRSHAAAVKLIDLRGTWLR